MAGRFVRRQRMRLVRRRFGGVAAHRDSRTVVQTDIGKRGRVLDRFHSGFDLFVRERHDFLPDAVFEQLEVVRRQSANDRTALVANDRVDEHEIEGAAKHRHARGALTSLRQGYGGPPKRSTRRRKGVSYACGVRNQRWRCGHPNGGDQCDERAAHGSTHQNLNLAVTVIVRMGRAEITWPNVGELMFVSTAAHCTVLSRLLAFTSSVIARLPPIRISR